MTVLGTHECHGPGECKAIGFYMQDTDPAHLLEPLNRVCTRLLDVYWNYEFCYKRFLRQFHEEKLANQVRLTE